MEKPGKEYRSGKLIPALFSRPANPSGKSSPVPCKLASLVSMQRIVQPTEAGNMRPHTLGACVALPTLVFALATPGQEPLVADASRLRVLQQKAAERIRTMDSYIVRMRRRETVNGQAGGEEIILA